MEFFLSFSESSSCLSKLVFIFFEKLNSFLEFVYQNGRFAKAPRPDLILLDLGLPGRDGREVLADLKADEKYNPIPIVVLTGSTAEEDVEAAKKLNVEGYMTKPVDMEQFLNLVRKLKNFWHTEVILPAHE